jgi:endonuclease-3 related protein
MNELLMIHKKLYRCFGPQNWWPGDTPFEIAVGAVLTQNTNWGNVEKAIQNLKKQGVLSSRGIHGLSVKELALLIKPAGYFNVKAKRLRSFLDFLMNEYQDGEHGTGRFDSTQAKASRDSWHRTGNSRFDTPVCP